MKKLFALCAGLFAAGYAQAQYIKVTNISCDPVVVVIYGDDGPCDNWLYLSSNYTVAPMTSLYLNMLPGGAASQVNWISGNIPTGPGNYFSSIKIFDAGGSWADYMSNTCLGKTTFTQKGSCIINGTWTDDASDPGSASVLIY